MCDCVFFPFVCRLNTATEDPAAPQEVRRQKHCGGGVSTRFQLILVSRAPSRRRLLNFEQYEKQTCSTSTFEPSKQVKGQVSRHVLLVSDVAAQVEGNTHKQEEFPEKCSRSHHRRRSADIPPGSVERPRRDCFDWKTSAEVLPSTSKDHMKEKKEALKWQQRKENTCHTEGEQRWQEIIS